MASRVLTTVAMFLPAAAVLASWLSWRDRLPAHIASHWTDLGTPDGTLPAPTMLAVTGGTAFLAAVIGAVTGQARPVRLLWAGALAGLAAGVWLVPVWLTMRAGSAAAVVLGPWFLVVLGCAAYGLVPFLLARARTPTR